MTLNNEQRRALYKRKKETAKRREEFWAKFGPLPAYLIEFGDLEPNITEEWAAIAAAQVSPSDKAPHHLKDQTDEHGGLDEAATKKQSITGGKARGAQQSAEALTERYGPLRSLYPQLIGTRGAAKKVYRLELKRLGGVETKDDKILSIRTLQKIFRAPRS